MAGLEVQGFDELIASFGDVADLPNDVASDMLNAGADVMVDSLKSHARTMLQGPYSAGSIANSIEKAKKPKKLGMAWVIDVEFKGVLSGGKHGMKHKKGKGTRAAEAAFVNEYGTGSQTGRPFIQTSNEKAADAIAAAGAEVVDRYLQSKNL